MGVVLGKFERRLQRKKTISSASLDDCGALTDEAGEDNKILKLAADSLTPVQYPAGLDCRQKKWSNGCKKQSTGTTKSLNSSGGHDSTGPSGPEKHSKFKQLCPKACSANFANNSNRKSNSQQQRWINKTTESSGSSGGKKKKQQYKGQLLTISKSKLSNGETGSGEKEQDRRSHQMTPDSGNDNITTNTVNNSSTTAINNDGIDYCAAELFRQNIIPLSPRDIYCLEKSWKGVALKMSETGLLLVTKLLELNPEYGKFFETRNGSPVPKHLQLQTAAENFMYAMDKCIDYLDNPKRFFTFIKNMGEFHIGIKNFRAEYFLDFSDPFLYAVREILGERYTTHIEEIYIRTINYIIFKIIEAYENSGKRKTYN